MYWKQGLPQTPGKYIANTKDGLLTKDNIFLSEKNYPLPQSYLNTITQEYIPFPISSIPQPLNSLLDSIDGHYLADKDDVLYELLDTTSQTARIQEILFKEIKNVSLEDKVYLVEK